MKVIEVKDLVKKYKEKTVVNGISFLVEKGELFSLLGVNGAGKTTTIKMLTTLSKKTSGEIFIFGKNLDENVNEVKTKINVSPQETSIAQNLSVKENLEFIASIYGIPKAKISSKVSEILKTFMLEDIKDTKAKKLSGGYQRRLSIAMALISSPEILFLDEPTLGLDVIARRELWKIINSLKGKTTIILTTHYMEEAEKLSDKVAIMKDGSILMIDNVQNIISSTDSKDLEDAFVKVVTGGEL